MTEKKSWSRAAWLSGALLVVPLAGLVALMVLGGDEDDGGRPVKEAPVAAAPVELPPAMPDPLPRPVAKPAKDEPVAEGRQPSEPSEIEEPSEPEREPSVLDPCCEALDELVAQEGPGLLRAAHRACTNATTFDDPSIGFRTVRRLLERQGYAVPRACER
ncbi:MAG: hypothetical protein RIF41_10145 [Polyangiaceae bacterium]